VTLAVLSIQIQSVYGNFYFNSSDDDLFSILYSETEYKNLISDDRIINNYPSVELNRKRRPSWQLEFFEKEPRFDENEYMKTFDLTMKVDLDVDLTEDLFDFSSDVSKKEDLAVDIFFNL
jgi:hypothetical protein